MLPGKSGWQGGCCKLNMARMLSNCPIHQAGRQDWECYAQPLAQVTNEANKPGFSPHALWDMLSLQ